MFSYEYNTENLNESKKKKKKKKKKAYFVFRSFLFSFLWYRPNV